MANTVYLLCLSRPYRAKTGKKQKESRHYLGYSRDLEERLRLHAAGQGARFLAVARQDGITWEVVRTWPGGRDLEVKLKRRHGFRSLCPRCNERLRHLLEDGQQTPIC